MGRVKDLWPELFMPNREYYNEEGEKIMRDIKGQTTIDGFENGYQEELDRINGLYDNTRQENSNSERCHCGPEETVLPWDSYHDPINRPEHYTDGKYECIDVMQEIMGIFEVKNFCICNAWKYLWRHQKKNGVEDIKKAIWYLNKFIELEEAINNG